VSAFEEWASRAFRFRKGVKIALGTASAAKPISSVPRTGGARAQSWSRTQTLSLQERGERWYG